MTGSTERGTERKAFWHRRPWVMTAAMLGVWLSPFRIIVDDLWSRIQQDAQIALVVCVWLTLLALGLRGMLRWFLRSLLSSTRMHGAHAGTGDHASTVQTTPSDG